MNQKTFEETRDWRDEHCFWGDGIECGGEFDGTEEFGFQDFCEGDECPFCGLPITFHATPQEAGLAYFESMHPEDV